MENRKNQLRNIFSILLVSFSVGLFAQNKFSFKEDILGKTAIGLDYNYIGRNSLAVGIDYNAGSQEKSITVGAFGRYFRGVNSKDHFNPELKVGYYDGGGYAIPFDSEKNLKGFSIGVSINIGLTYMSKYYDKFVFMR